MEFTLTQSPRDHPMAATSALPPIARDEAERAGERPKWFPLPLDPEIFSPDADELAFFTETTGIQDDNELREHITKVQQEAYEVYPYPCIRNYNFTKLKISRLPAYPQMLELVKTRPDAVYLDIGCCFGNDARKAVVDGFPMANIICSDLRPQYWDLGFELFRDKATFHVPFVAGDAFDPAFLSPTLIDKSGPRPALTEVKVLTELQGDISIIHASAFFHLFNEELQEKLAYLTANLLVKKPGSFIFGAHVGQSVAGIFWGGRGYGHSPESWTALWETVLGKGKCEVKAEIQPWKGVPGDPRGDRELLLWSVTLI